MIHVGPKSLIRGVWPNIDYHDYHSLSSMDYHNFPYEETSEWVSIPIFKHTYAFKNGV